MNAMESTNSEIGIVCTLYSYILLKELETTAVLRIGYLVGLFYCLS